MNVYRSVPRGLFFFLIVVTVAVVPVWSQLPGSIVTIEYLGQWSPRDIETAGEDLFEWYGVPEAQYSVDEYIVHYHTRDFDGTPVTAKSQLFIPVASEPEELPVLLFASGTTGIADMCAPSLEQPEVERWGYYRTNMASYATQGIITIFPDYVGFNDPERAQRYFSKAAEAHLLLDGHRAVLSFFASHGEQYAATPAAAAFTAGYSQGGHAALAAADLWKSYAPEVPLRGAIGFAATSNVTTLIQEGPYYAPYIFYSYREMYGDEIDPAEYLQPRYARTLEEDLQGMCVKEMELHYPYDGRRLFTPSFYRALQEGTLAEEFPALHRRLEENLTGLSGHSVPTLLVQGFHDIIVTPAAQKRYAAELCEAGVSVHYIEYADARHRHTRPAGFQASVDWIRNITNGGTPPSDCSTY